MTDKARELLAEVAANFFPRSDELQSLGDRIRAYLATQPSAPVEAREAVEPYAWFWTDGSEHGCVMLRQDYEQHRRAYPRMTFTPVYISASDHTALVESFARLRNALYESMPAPYPVFGMAGGTEREVTAQSAWERRHKVDATHLRIRIKDWSRIMGMLDRLPEEVTARGVAIARANGQPHRGVLQDKEPRT